MNEEDVRALVTSAPCRMDVIDRPETSPPKPGQVLVRSEVVGICGSDYHFLTGELVTPPAFGPQYPRVQGHEICGRIESLGDGCPPHLSTGQRVAIWPLSSCGHCYACGIGRENACPDFRLVGVHHDGALQEVFGVDAEQVFPVGDLRPEPAAFCEPMAVAIRALERGRAVAGERVLVLGAGPVGQAVAVAAQERCARVLVSDPIAERLELARRGGAETIEPGEGESGDVTAAARQWARGGPHVVVDCTGRASAVRTGVEAVAPAGRVVVVGISREEAPLPVNAFTEREIDVLGSAVSTSNGFAEAVRVVKSREQQVQRLITHRSSFERGAAAVDHAMRHPEDVVKLVIKNFP